MPEWMTEIARHLEPLGLRPEREREIAEELAAHLEDRYSDARGRGMSHDDARAAALAELGDTLVRELQRVETAWPEPAPALGNSRRARIRDTVVNDVRYALRGLRLSPGFTAVALITLALGIGACTLMLSAVNGVLLKQLPFTAPDRLVQFWGTAPEKGLPEVSFPEGLAALYRDKTQTLEVAAAFSGNGFTLTGSGDAERIDGASVSTEFFRVLGVAPGLGRVPVRGEDTPDRASMVVLSHALWMRRFGGDSTLVGRTIDLDGAPVTVVGVMPAGFDFPNRSDAWVPLHLDATRFNCWCYDMIGRMKAERTPDDVKREIAAITDAFGLNRRDVFPDARPGGARIVVMPLAQKLVGNLQRPLLILLAGVACVLLIVCANIANLLLARTAARMREIAVRCCLGASPRRVAAQLLTESLILSLGGAALGALLAAWWTQGVRRLPVDQFPRIDQVRLDPLVLAATIGVALLTGVCCGVAPAWRATRVDLSDAIKNGVKGSGTRTSRRVSNAFVIAQFALSVMLLVAAGLLFRSYHRLANVDTGYHADGALVARVQLPYPRYDSANVVRAFYGRLLDNVRAIPGVRAVGLASRVPLGRGNPQDNVVAEGKESRPGEPVRVANIRLVTSDYFAAMGTPLLRGRAFRSSDDERATRVAVVDDLFAKHFWPTEDPIGKRFRHGGDTSSGRWVTVIGVAPNIKHARLDEAGDLQVYENFEQRTPWGNYVVVRAPASAERGLANELRRALKALDPAIPLFDVHWMQDAVDQSLSTRRVTNILLGGFALTALLLAVVGIYGVMSLGVSGRSREFGIRLALGGQPGAVRTLVLRQAMWLALAGISGGLLGALATTRLLGSLLFGIGPLDWVAFSGAAATLTVAALVASYVPARRATRADPMMALRAE
jgi:predicted permease